MSAELNEKLKIEPSWGRVLQPEFAKPYMEKLRGFLKQEIEKKKIIYPRPKHFFAAFDMTPFEKVKVVILGQDPYHGPDQAHGLSFSVPKGIPAPPSLVNIFKELNSDLGIERPEHGCLEQWAKQGVLLLNATLSVQACKAGSHQKKGWEEFTDKVIEHLNNERENLVFILWGAYAQKKGQHIDESKHLVLRSVHPSPLSSHRGFFGSKPFSKANAYLKKHNIEPIDWKL